MHLRAIRHVTLDGRPLMIVSHRLGIHYGYMILYAWNTGHGFGLEPLIAMSSVAAALKCRSRLWPLGPHGARPCHKRQKCCWWIDARRPFGDLHNLVLLYR